MDWEEKRAARARRAQLESGERPAPTPERLNPPRHHPETSFPNYLDPARRWRERSNEGTRRPFPAKTPKPEAQPLAKVRTNSQLPTFKRPDKDAYYQQLREDVRVYQQYRNHQPFRPSETPSIYRKKHSQAAPQGSATGARTAHFDSARALERQAQLSAHGYARGTDDKETPPYWKQRRNGAKQHDE